jgi:hypothetical protein
LMMTWFLMQPVLLQVDQQALTPYRAGTITGEQAMELGAAPVKAYMLRYAREKDLALFVSAGMTAAEKRTGTPYASGRAGIHAQRVEGGISDWSGAVPAVPSGGHGHRQHYDLDRHDAAAAGGDLNAGENPAVCDGGWMAATGEFALEKLLMLRKIKDEVRGIWDLIWPRSWRGGY